MSSVTEVRESASPTRSSTDEKLCPGAGAAVATVGVNLYAVSLMDLRPEVAAWVEKTCGAVEMSGFLRRDLAKQKPMFMRLLSAGKRVSFHGPTQETESVLEGLALEFGVGGRPENGEVRVVGHADVVAEAGRVWSELRAALLIENLGENRDPGGTFLAAAFEANPEAELCLDVSHVLNTAESAGQAEERMWALAETYPIGEIHMGCMMEARPGERYTSYETMVRAGAIAWAQRMGSLYQVPVILEGGDLETGAAIHLEEAGRILDALGQCC